MHPKVIFLMGPTASGKTGLAELLYEELPCELISVDSSAVYRGLDIGSAKPEPELLARMPHRLIDIRDPIETYSAADFLTDALAAINEIHANGKHALLVGGTMLYFKALRDGLAELPAADPDTRRDIEQQANQHGWAAVHAELASVDPQSAARIHPNDPQRLQRALEVYRLTGLSMTELHQQQNDNSRRLKSPPLQISIQPSSRELLHQRIEQRFDQMLENGLVEEVRQLLQQPGAELLPALRAVGYRQAVQYLRGELDAAGLRERGVIASRQLAKRQLTWLRGWPAVHTLQATGKDYRQGFVRPINKEQSSIFHQALQIC